VILLLGDSITQMGSNEYDGATGWVAKMQAHYNRKVSSSSSTCIECKSHTKACQQPVVHKQHSMAHKAAAKMGGVHVCSFFGVLCHCSTPGIHANFVR
jgi:hypothetical protein